jgi:hypothetical protein
MFVINTLIFSLLFYMQLLIEPKCFEGEFTLSSIGDLRAIKKNTYTHQK